MTKELEQALRHIKTRADAWAVKEIEHALEQPIDKFSSEYHKIYMQGWNDGRRKLVEAMEREIAI